jgi:hypothetical protein
MGVPEAETNQTSTEGDDEQPAFLRARTKEHVEQRKKEIIDACHQILISQGYDAITFQAISEMISCTRQSIYKYYRTKEEILLDILYLEQVSWERDMYAQFSTRVNLNKEEYARMMTDVFLNHKEMIHLTSRLNYGLEVQSSIEKLTEYRSSTVDIYHILLLSVSRYFPDVPFNSKRGFATIVFAFLVGLYPMNNPSVKFLEAERRADSYDVYPEGLDRTNAFETLCYNGILFLISNI